MLGQPWRVPLVTAVAVPPSRGASGLLSAGCDSQWSCSSCTVCSASSASAPSITDGFLSWHQSQTAASMMLHGYFPLFQDKQEMQGSCQEQCWCADPAIHEGFLVLLQSPWDCVRPGPAPTHPTGLLPLLGKVSSSCVIIFHGM